MFFLTSSMPLVCLYTLWKHQKIGGSNVLMDYRKRPVGWNGLLSLNSLTNFYWLLQIDDHEGKDFFHPQSGVFWPSFVALSVALALILIFGIFFECFRKAIWCCKGKITYNAANLNMFKVNKWDTKIICEICSKSTIQTPKRRY